MILDMLNNPDNTKFESNKQDYPAIVSQQKKCETFLKNMKDIVIKIKRQIEVEQNIEKGKCDDTHFKRDSVTKLKDLLSDPHTSAGDDIKVTKNTQVLENINTFRTLVMQEMV